MTLEEMLKSSLLSAAAAKIAADKDGVDDGEVEVEHTAVSTYAADDVTVTIHSDMGTHVLEKVVISVDSTGAEMDIVGEDVHSFMTVMARVLKGMTSKQP